jgi:hypothetical protein
LFIANSEKDMYWAEEKLVVISDQTYNLCPGGRGGRKGIAVVKDENNNIHMVDVTDERIKNGSLVGVSKGISCINSGSIRKGERRSPKTEFKPGIVSVVLEDGSFTKISKSDFDKSTFKGVTSGAAPFIHQVTKENKTFSTNEFIGLPWVGVSHLDKEILICDSNTGTFLGKTTWDDKRWESSEICSLKSYFRVNCPQKCQCGKTINSIYLLKTHLGNCRVSFI